MKKTKKLEMHRETVRKLNSKELGVVAGADASGPPSCLLVTHCTMCR
jgi:hypothetical protein